MSVEALFHDDLSGKAFNQIFNRKRRQTRTLRDFRTPPYESLREISKPIENFFAEYFNPLEANKFVVRIGNPGVENPSFCLSLRECQISGTFSSAISRCYASERTRIRHVGELKV